MLAIKDEYEVARLFTGGEFLKKVQATFEGDYRLNFHLAPPLLNKGKKSSYGPWMLKGFKVLAGLRRLRNTWLDPFARTRERKVELAWLRDYEALLDEMETGLRADNLELAVKLASLPDAVRGYGAVKDRYLGNAENEKARLLDEWRNGPQFHEAGAVRIHAVQV